MIQFFKRLANHFSHYEPLAETSSVRGRVNGLRSDGWTRCPDYYGDLLYQIIRRNNFRRCLETGFSTGTSAAYMALAVADRDGEVVSISLDEDPERQRGMSLLKSSGLEKYHHHIHANSNRVMAKFLLDKERFDFIYMDGWKTFNFLAYEMYIYNQLLSVGGIVFFDDTYMPGVRRAVRMMKRYYGFEEIDFRGYNHTTNLRLYEIITRRSFTRAYRALIKTTETEHQGAIADPYFDRSV